jgi:hypothetical protein
VVYILGPTSGSPVGWIDTILAGLYRKGIQYAACVDDWTYGEPAFVLSWYQRNIERAKECGCVLVWVPAPVTNRSNRPYALVTMQKLGALEARLHAGSFPIERIAVGIDQNIPTYPLIVESFRLSVSLLTIHHSVEGTLREAAAKAHIR